MKYSKGFAPVLIVLIVMGVLATGGGAYYLGKNSKNIPIQNTERDNSILPDSFSMEMYGDYDSSGADRNYQGELTFKNNQVKNGYQVYIVGEGRNCQENCNRKIECMAVNQKWVDKTTGGECTIDAYSTPLTKEGIIQKINEGKLIQTEDLSKCKHAVTCYKITNARFNNDKIGNNSITKIFQSIIKKEVKNIENPSFPSENEKIINDFTLNGNNCYNRTNYFIITRADPSSAGDDILIKYKSDKNKNIACDYLAGKTDFELKNSCNDGPICYRAQHLSSVKGNLLIVDEGTGTENRNIVIYDLVKKAKVFNDTYNSSVDSIEPQGDLISYWQTTNTVANSQNCPKIKEYQNQGGGAKIEIKISLDLSDLTKKELGETRCSYSQ